MLLACNHSWPLRKNTRGIIINNNDDVPRHDNYSLFLNRRKLLSSSLSFPVDDEVVASKPISVSRFSIQLRSFFFVTGFMIKQPHFRFFVPFSVPLFQLQFWMPSFFIFFLPSYYTAIKLVIIVLYFWFVACLMVFIGVLQLEPKICFK